MASKRTKKQHLWHMISDSRSVSRERLLEECRKGCDKGPNGSTEKEEREECVEEGRGKVLEEPLHHTQLCFRSLFMNSQFDKTSNKQSTVNQVIIRCLFIVFVIKSTSVGHGDPRLTHDYLLMCGCVCFDERKLLRKETPVSPSGTHSWNVSRLLQLLILHGFNTTIESQNFFL